jgi:hypothetical protein
LEIDAFIFEIEARTFADAVAISLWVEKFPLSACSIAALSFCKLVESSLIAFVASVEAGAGGAPSPPRLPVSAWFAELIACEALLKSACEADSFAPVVLTVDPHDAMA